MVIDELINDLLPDSAGGMRKQVDEIIAMKKEGTELTRVSGLSVFEDYLMQQLADLSQYSPDKAEKAAIDHFDGLFRELLDIFG